jgi:hypothetical protein
MESGRWPRALKTKKPPLATQDSIFRLGGSFAAIPVTGARGMYFGNRPKPVIEEIFPKQSLTRSKRMLAPQWPFVGEGDMKHCEKCNSPMPPDELRCIRCGFESPHKATHESAVSSNNVSKASTGNTASTRQNWGAIWAQQMKERRSRRWWIFLTIYLAWFSIFVITMHKELTPVAAMGLGVVSGFMPSLLITYVLNLIWSIWQAISRYKKSNSDGLLEAIARSIRQLSWTSLLEAIARSIRQLSWTRLFAGVLTSKTFFVFAIFIGGAVFSISDIIRVESGIHGNQVRALDTRMAVIAIIPNAANASVHKVVQIPLGGVERFKQENPNYSFLPPLGNGEIKNGSSSLARTAYSVTSAGLGRVMVETKLDDDEDHVLGRYEATDREIKPLYTKTHNDFLGWMVGTLFGIAFAIVLASVGYVLKWRLRRKAEGATATIKSLFGSGIRRLGRLTAIAFMCVGILLVVALVLSAISKLGLF